MPTVSLGNSAHLNQVPEIHFAILRAAPNVCISLTQAAVHLVGYVLVACVSRGIGGEGVSDEKEENISPIQGSQALPSSPSGTSAVPLSREIRGTLDQSHNIYYLFI